jgi:dipeptidyl aminopeptidase/acylaminoacyl peptidase
MRYLISLLLTMFLGQLLAQAPNSYQVPPKAIADLIEAPSTPVISISPDNKWMLVIERPSLPTIEELGAEELRLAGLRINPVTNGPSRSVYATGLTLMPMEGGTPKHIRGLPSNPRIEGLSWSNDGTSIAFLNSVQGGSQLWVIDVATAAAHKYTEGVINNTLRGGFRWIDNGKTILYQKIVDNRGGRPPRPKIPSGPNVQLSTGKAAPVRTFQDLLANKYDEVLFEYYCTSELTTLNISTGKITPLGLTGIFTDVTPSPDGNYLLVTRIKKPFSYIVPLNSFPKEVNIVDHHGKHFKLVADLPAEENIPAGFNAVPTGPRSFNWRADKPATLYWVEALDGGNPKTNVEFRDKLFCLEAPFSAQPKEVMSFTLRYGGITWGDDNLAIAMESWWSTRREITRMWKPGKPAEKPLVLFDRSYEDRYTDPGNFETKPNMYGRNVLLTADKGKSLYLTGQGASPEGNRPFLDKFDITTKKTTRLWRSEAPYYETVVSLLDETKGMVLTRREANYEQPNYYLRNLNSGKLTQVTNFPNPYEALKGVTKELIKFKRADGLDMTGTLYVPKGYDRQKNGPLPVLMWAYPREFKSADAAGQLTNSPYEFIRVSPSSPILFVMNGYAVFDNVSMPIIGEAEKEPNETFVEQLRMNAEAAINEVVNRGIADRNKIAVGGHSYGAFMTANLLAHTDLFAAGIARSGAYNRTLTPFGFQSEERTYWQTPETYFKMSPFNYADKMKEPLLMIHGEADNNSGTFPIQSERMFAALKGHGATVKLVMLPHESHGYQAKESLLHTAWETNDWLEKYVKNNNKTIQP